MRQGLGLAGLPPTAVGREMAFGSHTGQRQLLDQVCSVLFCLKAGASLRLYWRPPGEGSLEPRQKVIKMLSLWTKSKDFTSPAPSTLRPWRIKTSKCHEALRGHTQEDFILRPERKSLGWLAEFPAVEFTRKSRLQKVGMGTFFEKTKAHSLTGSLAPSRLVLAST